VQFTAILKELLFYTDGGIEVGAAFHVHAIKSVPVCIGMGIRNRLHIINAIAVFWDLSGLF
jgi:hypothetical protein